MPLDTTLPANEASSEMTRGVPLGTAITAEQATSAYFVATTYATGAYGFSSEATQAAFYNKMEAIYEALIANGTLVAA